MCGVAGFVGRPLTEDGLIRKWFEELSIRGHDGHGLVAYRPDRPTGKRVMMFKDNVPANNYNLAKLPSVVGATTLLMHTRAATSGTRMPIDCHPLGHNGIWIVHNGGITNDTTTRTRLNIPDSSPAVDSYLIAHVIGEASTIEEGIRNVFRELMGSMTFLVLSAKAPHTIWAASNNGSLYQFKHKGNDYLCSTQTIFENALTTERKGKLKRLKKAGYVVRGPLQGAWELTPQTFRQLLDQEQISKLLSEGWDIRNPKATQISKGEEVSAYLVGRWNGGGSNENGRIDRDLAGLKDLGISDGKVGALEATDRIYAGSQLQQRYLKALRKKELTEVAQELSVETVNLKFMPEIIKLLDGGEVALLAHDPGNETSCLWQCERPARVLFENCEVCWTCLCTWLEYLPETVVEKPVTEAVVN